MEQHYSFNSDEEPTDEQLAWLMHEVGEEVRRRGAEADRKFRENVQRQVREAQLQWAKMAAGKKDNA